MPFNTISDAPVRGYPGQIAEPLAPKFARTATLEAVGASGSLLVRGTDPDDQVRPATTGDTLTSANLVGIQLLSDTNPLEYGSPNAIGTPVSALRLGTVFLNFANTPVAGHCVAYTLATGVYRSFVQGVAAGTIGVGAQIVPGLRVSQSAAGAGIAAVEVNFYGSQDTATVGA